ncbi:hypothetical protein ACLI1A_07090 [Flavobacterium sp. RHBU_3]|uniref:hypothetical protein n=1 Tax=Flavobacterium sp. RHBU_3 TaxID=3391184 RepID=UPI00398549C1
MSTVIKYTNNDSEQISLQQIMLLKSYNKETYVNSELKLVERLQVSRKTSETYVVSGEYYLSNDEDLQTVIDQHLPLARDWHFYYNKQSNSNGDIFWEYLFYEYGLLNEKGKLVLNSDNLLLSFCKVNIDTNQITDKRKNFYGDINIYQRSNYKYPYLTVFYYQDNSVSEIYIDDEDFSLNDFLLDPYADIFVWNDHPYYHSFDPMLPNDDIV